MGVTRNDEDRVALRAFWQFYEPRSALIATESRRVAGEQLPSWRVVFAAQPREQVEQDQRRMLTLQRAAILEGQWARYTEELRAQGARYAQAGISYASWFDLMGVFRDVVRHHLRRALHEDVDRHLEMASAASDGVTVFLDIVIKHVGEAYLDTSRQLAVQSEARYRAMFENSTVPMWTIDRTTLRFESVNDATVHHYGYSREEFATMTLADVRPPEEVAAMTVAVAAPPAGIVEKRMWRHLTKDGTIITVEIKANDIELDGRQLRVVHIIDVTDRVRAQEALRKIEDQLRHAQKMDAIGALASGVAHDFNNVLMVIGNTAELLEEDLEADDRHRDDVVEIRRATERGVAITRQLLTMSRRATAAPGLLDLDDVIAGFLPFLVRLVGPRITIDHRRAELPTVFADRSQIEQVVMNLAVNARDAMSDGGRLLIETEVATFDAERAAGHSLREGVYVTIAVTDSGAGMDADTQQRIFEPFFTTKESGKGTGLGLAIVHGIVGQAGGAISVYSELGHGTTFRVHLPANSRVAAASESTVLVVAPRDLSPTTVLVVDNEEHVRSVTGRTLQVAGCAVLYAATADEARRICVSHEGAIGVALVDIGLPDERGDVVAVDLHALRPAMSLILMSGYPAAASDLMKTQSTAFLTKPFSPADLRLAVARAVGLMEDPVRVTDIRANSKARQSVLLADDDDAFRRAMARFLTRLDLDLDVVDVSNGRAAIAALKSRRFELVVSDVHMPELGGLDLLRAVRRVDLDVPVILMSGEPELASAVSAVEYGAFRYLTKPLDMDALKVLVGHALRSSALARLRREALVIGGASRQGAADRAGTEVRFESAMSQMWMAYQPIVDARTGALFGVEALMRTVESSMSNPQLILDAATQLGRLVPLGRRVRELSAIGVGPLRDDALLFVNLHPTDIHDAELVNEDAALTRIASRVVLEITERTALESSAHVAARIDQLRKLGFRIAIDDIGAGYSGLTSFADLTPEIVKIDMSLIRDVHRSVVRQRTIRALCSLCHEGGATVVGEGVETEAERDCLVELGCDLLQGYYFGRPVRELPA